MASNTQPKITYCRELSQAKLVELFIHLSKQGGNNVVWLSLEERFEYPWRFTFNRWKQFCSDIDVAQFRYPLI